jgi:hypothetical protein
MSDTKPSINELVENIDSSSAQTATRRRINHLRATLRDCAHLLNELDHHTPSDLDDMNLSQLQGLLGELTSVANDLEGHVQAASHAQQRLQLEHFDVDDVTPS